jgi:phosphomannomutase
LVRELQNKFGYSFYLRKDIAIPRTVYDKKEFTMDVSGKLPSKLFNLKVKDVRTYDGVKIVLSDDSWLLLRPSGTEPKLRIYAESPSISFTKKLLVWGEKLIQAQ